MLQTEVNISPPSQIKEPGFARWDPIIYPLMSMHSFASKIARSF